MSLLIESIKILNGRIYNLERHENRIDRSRLAMYSQVLPSINLRQHIQIPTHLDTGLVKCRIVYGENITEVTYSDYIPKKINTLKIVEDNKIDYSHKYLDRNHINDLYNQREDCDDIVIVKEGKITDSSYSNLALLKNGIWYTPSSCLLHGTRRQQLIHQGRLVECNISVDDFHNYDKVSLINAMIGLGSLQVDIQNCR